MTGYFHGGRKQYWWRERFLIHEIGRTNGRRGFRTGGNVFRIGGNTFYDWKNKIPMKIPELKRSGIGLIAEFHRISNGFPNQENRRVLLSMPEYTKKALVWFGHKPPAKPQHQQHKHTKPTYGATIHYAKATDATKPISKDEKKCIQQVIGTLLYYGRAVDDTILVALSSLASAQSTPTKDTMQ
jgi:hypothetical protein